MSLMAVPEKIRTTSPAAKRQTLPPAKVQQILPLVVDYANGLTQATIAKKHGIHVQTLRKRLHEAGVDTRGHLSALNATDLRSARRAISEGASLRATARRLGVAHTTLQRALRRAER